MLGVGLATLSISTHGIALPGIVAGFLIGLLLSSYGFLWILHVWDFPTAAWSALFNGFQFAGIGGGINAILKRYVKTGVLSVLLYLLSLAISLRFEW